MLLPASLQGNEVVSPLGHFISPRSTPVPHKTPVDLLMRADDVVHDDAAPLQARIIQKVFRGSEFLYRLQLPSGHEVLAQVPSHHDHHIGEYIGIKAHLDHVVVFDKLATA